MSTDNTYIGPPLYHVIVTGSRPAKDSQGHYVAMPEENINFIKDVLNKLDKRSYAALYHGAAAGVDTVVDDYAFNNGIRVKQFPAYWYDPLKKGVDKRAGLFRNEKMVLAAKDAAHNKNSEHVIALAFYSTPTLEQSRGTNHCFEFAKKQGFACYAYQLPILSVTPTPLDQHPF